MCNSSRPSTYIMWSNVNLGSFGVTGVKRSFSLKCYNSSNFHSMTIRLIHVHQLESVYLCYGMKCQSGVIWGHWGQKVIFTQNAINSANLHSMTIRLIHVHQLVTLYLSYGVKYQSGVTWGQKVIFTKNAIFHPCYIASP